MSKETEDALRKVQDAARIVENAFADGMCFLNAAGREMARIQARSKGFFLADAELKAFHESFSEPGALQSIVVNSRKDVELTLKTKIGVFKFLAEHFNIDTNKRG